MNRQPALRRRPSGATLIAIAIVAVLAGVVAVVFWPRDVPEGATSETDGSETAAVDEDLAAGEVWAANLYFPSTGGLLLAEAREVPASAETAERISALVTTLLAGPRGRGMRPPLPDNVTVRKVYLAEDGLAFLDLESPDGAPPPASGSLREMLTVYSLVNTVLLNFDELERIVLLWNGRQLKTFAGHLDTMRPLAANTDVVARSP